MDLDAIAIFVLVLVGILLFVDSSMTAPRFDLSDVWPDAGRRRPYADDDGREDAPRAGDRPREGSVRRDGGSDEAWKAFENTVRHS